MSRLITVLAIVCAIGFGIVAAMKFQEGSGTWAIYVVTTGIWTATAAITVDARTAR